MIGDMLRDGEHCILPSLGARKHYFSLYDIFLKHHTVELVHMHHQENGEADMFGRLH